MERKIELRKRIKKVLEMDSTIKESLLIKRRNTGKSRVYSTAVYLRLSREDSIHGSSGAMDIIGAESNSIQSQKEMICSFIKRQDNMEIYDIYADDGFSGTNFDRPEFKRMMCDIEAGCVNCVIVKDLSRLGRDYIEAGRLIQKTFPAFSVRFIALNDHFDSLTADYYEAALVVPVKNFVNDSYSRDISDKVRSHQKIRRERGDFIGAFAVYGYEKSKDNRNLLVPDAYAAGVVRRIFQWKMEGYSNFAIAQQLEKFGILSPMEYKKLHGVKLQTGFVTGVKMKWSAAAVKRILTNENYIGTLVQGKEEKLNYKIKKSIRKPEKEWTRVPKAHEPIVSRQVFDIVQDFMKVEMRVSRGEKKPHIYAGILFCGDCMKPMTRRVSRCKGKETVAFICSTNNKGGKCSRHTITEEELKKQIFLELSQKNGMFLDGELVLASREQVKYQLAEMKAYERELEMLYQERESYSVLRVGMDEDLKKQIITKEDFETFVKIYEQRYQKLLQTIHRQEEAKKILFPSEAGSDSSQENSVQQRKEYDRIAFVMLVKRILVYEENRVCLELRDKEPSVLQKKTDGTAKETSEGTL